MDQVKIGKFIAERRKMCNLTQMQLAEKLDITDRAVSKWENGKALPDASKMLSLCEVLNITVNDLLSGEVVTVDYYDKALEKNLLEMVKQKEASDKKMLSLEIVIGIFSTIILLGFVFTASFVPMENWLRVCLIIVGFVIGMIGIGFALKIEQTAGYYECRKCHHRYVPTIGSVLWAMHVNRTRYMKCPKCNQRSWNKKVLSKE